jgi:hypothetical protein
MAQQQVSKPAGKFSSVYIYVHMMLVGPPQASAEVHNQSIQEWLNIELNQDHPSGSQLLEEAVALRSSTPVAATIFETATTQS